MLLAVLVGCGGGGSGSTPAASSSSGGRGQLDFQIQWPAPPIASRAAARAKAPTRDAGAVPQGTAAIQVSVTDPTTNASLAPVQKLLAPSQSVEPFTQTVSFSNLPVGQVRVTATAFSDRAMALPAIGQGSILATISLNAIAHTTIPVHATAARITISPSSVGLSPSSSSQVLTATVFDAANNPLVYPLFWSVPDSNTATPTPITLTPDASNSAQATVALISGSTSSTHAVVNVVEPNSGLSASVTVTVGASAPASIELVGRILQLETNQPVQDVLIQIGGQSQTSSQQGVFAFFLSPGPTSAQLFPPTPAAPRTLSLVLTANAFIDLGDIYLSNSGYGANANGIVRRADSNQPVFGAIVTISGAMARTGDDGSFRITGLPIGLGSTPATQIGTVDATGFQTASVFTASPLHTGDNNLGTILISPSSRQSYRPTRHALPRR